MSGRLFCRTQAFSQPFRVLSSLRKLGPHGTMVQVPRSPGPQNNAIIALFIHDDRCLEDCSRGVYVFSCQNYYEVSSRLQFSKQDATESIRLHLASIAARSPHGHGVLGASVGGLCDADVGHRVRPTEPIKHPTRALDPASTCLALAHCAAARETRAHSLLRRGHAACYHGAMRMPPYHHWHSWLPH